MARKRGEKMDQFGICKSMVVQSFFQIDGMEHLKKKNPPLCNNVQRILVETSSFSLGKNNGEKEYCAAVV